MQKKIVSIVKVLFVTSVFFMFVGSIYSQTSTVSYTASNEDFANPERGFCRYTITYASNYSFRPLRVNSYGQVIRAGFSPQIVV